MDYQEKKYYLLFSFNNPHLQVLMDLNIVKANNLQIG